MYKVMLYFAAGLVAAMLLLVSCRTSEKLFTQYLAVETPTARMGEIWVQFLGNTTLLFSDGETAILTDGFFTRPGMFQLLFGKIAPDSAEITRCLNKAGIGQLNAVVALHSHFDHAMDAPLVARFTGAKLIGSTSTANIGRGCNLPDSALLVPPLNQPLQIGNFKLTFIKNNHWPYPNARLRKQLLNNSINNPLIPPANMEDYKEGDTYTLLIDYDTLKMAVQGSAGFAKGALSGYRANLLFLGIGGLELMDDTYNNDYQHEVTDALNPDVIVPVHWDDITARLTDRPKTVNLLVSLLQGINPQKALKQVVKRNNKRKIITLPFWKPVPVHRLISGQKSNYTE